MNTDEKIRTFHIATYGCQMNLADSSTLAAVMAGRGYRQTDSEKEADLIILNTCSVRQKAEQRIFGRLGELRGLRQQRPGLKVAVVGCMAQRLGDKIIEQAPGVDFVLGTDRVFELPDVIENTNGDKRVLTHLGHENLDDITPARENSYSAFVTISRGCDNYCTYCIVPYVRGRERAHSADFIIAGMKKMADEGVVEVTLLGQNVNSYQCDGTGFPELLKRAAEESGIPRIRFMTSHPKDLSEKLVDVMAEHPQIMPHIHLPMQSGANRILKSMGRVYTIERYLDVVSYIRARLDYVSLTTDLIVGFPGETEEEYQATLGAVEKIQFDSAFMFRYSVRPGTKAAEYEDDVAEKEKIRRLNKLIALQQEISHERNQREVGQVRQAVVEGPARRDKGQLRARTEGNKIVLFAESKPAIGSVVPVKITSADAFTLHGELQEAEP